MNTLKIITTALVAAIAFVAYPKSSSSKTLTYGDGELLEAGDTLTFELSEAPEEINGQMVLDEFLPDGISVEWTGKKFKTPKSATPKVKKDKDTGDYDIVISEKGEDNPCGLKVSYKKSSGRISGSFKVYTYYEGKKGKPKIKSWSAKFSGLIGDELSVTIKKAGVYTATLE